MRALSILACASTLLVAGAASAAETIHKKGTDSAGHTCEVTVQKNADGSITTMGASGGSSTTTGSTASSLSSSSSAGNSSVNIQAGNGSVSSSSSTGGPGSTSSSTVTVNGCTISTSSN